MPKLPISRYASRRRWTIVDAEAVLGELDASGLSPGEFAVREGLDVQRLYFWRRRLGARRTVSAPAFVEVRARASETVDVVLRNGRVLRVPESVDASSLLRLVEALERSTPC